MKVKKYKSGGVFDMCCILAHHFHPPTQLFCSIEIIKKLFNCQYKCNFHNSYDNSNMLLIA